MYYPYVLNISNIGTFGTKQPLTLVVTGFAPVPMFDTFPVQTPICSNIFDICCSIFVQSNARMKHMF